MLLIQKGQMMTNPPTPPYTEATVELLAAAIAAARDDDVFSDSEWNGSHWEVNRDLYRGDARSALNALVKAGLLLPEGAETRTEWGSHVTKVAAGQRSITALLAEMADVLHRLAQASEAHEKVLAGDAVRLAEGDSSKGISR